MDNIMQPFSLKTMSYWKALDLQLITCPPLIRKAMDHDVQKLNSFTGTYAMLPEWYCGNGLLSRNLRKITFVHLNGTKFMCKNLGDLIHEKSIDNTDYFKLGVNKFLSQVHENTIEQDTMINKEMIHFDCNTLYVITNDYRNGLLNDSDSDENITQQVVMTFRETQYDFKKCLVVSYEKVQNKDNDDPSNTKDIAIYCEQ